MDKNRELELYGKIEALNEENEKLRTLLRAVVGSKALQEAEFYSYCEAIVNAKEFLESQ